MDIKDFALDDETNELLTAAEAEKRKKASGKTTKTRKRREAFIILTKTQLNMLTGVANPTTMVLLHLMFLDFMARGKPFRFANDALTDIGVSERAKQRALITLEDLGWISVERNQGKEPVVTITRSAG